MAFNWYPFSPDDYRRDTYHLSAAADGIYRRLIDEYMVTGKSLPDCDASLAGIARVTADEWGSHREPVRAFFKARDGRLFHKRCEQELHAQRIRAASRSRSAREAATVRWAKEKAKQRAECEPHAESNADAMRLPATLTLSKNKLTTASVVEGQRESERGVASAELTNLIQKWN